MKTCKDCSIEKVDEDFYKSNKKGQIFLSARCKTCHKLYMNRLRSTEEQRLKRAKYFQDNKESIRLRNSKYCAVNNDRINERNKLRYHNDSLYRIYTNLKNRIEQALFHADAKDECSARKLLGGDKYEIAKHIEMQFKSGMSWENKSEWHIDHIIPISAFDLKDPKQQNNCFHFKNLQPLWKTENMKKGKKIPSNL